jgi:arabinogalactan oligomer / maltooligosaccharide transport system permease protein
MALILSGVFPGLGQLYNRDWLRGAAFLIAGVLLSWLVTRALPRDLEVLASAPLPAIALGALALLLAVWIWSVVDAWRRA